MLNKITSILLSVFTAFILLVNTAYAEGEKIYVVTHGADSDPFWTLIKNSVKNAGSIINVDITYLNPKNGSISEMAELLIYSVKQKPTGIITTIANEAILRKAFKMISDNNIPLITINTGSARQAKKIGSLIHVKQPEFKAGFNLGLKAKTAGAKSFLCVNHQKIVIVLEERCRGFADGLGVQFKNQMIDTGLDPEVIENRVMSYLKANPFTTAILTLGIVSAEATVSAVSKLDLDNNALFFATFDISQTIIEAIINHEIDVAVDQQPYLQGFLSVVLLANYIRYDIMPVNNIDSGPRFITRDKLGKIKEYIGKYR